MRLLFFHHALQGVLVLARKIHHLGHLGFGDLISEYAALPDSMMMAGATEDANADFFSKP